MNYLFGFAVSCAVFFNASFALANLKLGFVNFEAAFSQEQEAQKYIRDLETQENAIAADEQKARTEIDAKIARLKNSMAKLSEASRAAEEAKLSSEISDLQQKFTDRRTKLSTEKANKVAELENKNRLLVESISRNGGYSMVFNAATIVYVADDIKKKNDITQELISQYNKAYPVKATPTKPTPAPAPASLAPAKSVAPKK